MQEFSVLMQCQRMWILISRLLSFFKNVVTIRNIHIYEFYVSYDRSRTPQVYPDNRLKHFIKQDLNPMIRDHRGSRSFFTEYRFKLNRMLLYRVLSKISIRKDIGEIRKSVIICRLNLAAVPFPDDVKVKCVTITIERMY